MRSLSYSPVLFVFIASLLFVHRITLAESEFTSKTYLKFYDDQRGEKYAPLYEYMEMESRDRDKGLWNVYLSGWWGHDFSTMQDGNRNRDELTNAYVKVSPYADGRLLLNAGRHYVFEGVAALQLDGISTRWEPAPRYGLSLFGGVPVETEFDKRGGDSVFGGRVFQRISQKAEIGLSFINEINNDTRFREKTGLDLWIMPARIVELKGQSFYNNITEGWGEHAYALRIFPQKGLVLSGLFSHTSYHDMFSAATLTVFSSDFLGKDETLTKAGGLIEYRFGDSITGILDYTHYSYKTMGDAAYYGAKLASTAYGVSSGMALHRMEGAVDKLRYLESRIYAAKDAQNVRFSIDAISHHYDLPISGMRDAYSVNGSIRYAVSNTLASNFSVDYGKTPDFVYTTTVLLCMVYTFNSGR